MPSPVGHSFMGYIIYLFSTKRSATKTWLLVVSYLIVANIPDLDFLPGIIIGDLRRFHHGVSHSIAFSVLFGLLIGAFCSFKKTEEFKKAFALAFILYLSHILLDYLVLSPGRGVPLFRPLSGKYFMTPVLFFPYFDYVGPNGHVLTTLFSLHNLRTITFEILILSPLLFWATIRRRRKQTLTVNPDRKMPDR